MKIEKLKDLLKDFGDKVKFDYDLKKMNWFNIGGKTKAFYKADNLKDLVIFLKKLKNDEKIFILGAGSNTLITDKIYDGVVIKLSNNFNNISLLSEDIIIAGSAVLDKALSVFAMNNELSGFEFLTGIPGTIGGGIKMNAGCFGKEFKDILLSVQAIDKKGNVLTIAKKDINFEYRESGLSDDLIFLSASFRGKKDNLNNIKLEMNRIKAEKEKNQPSKIKTSGSTFKNPVSQTQKKVWELIKESVPLDKKFGDSSSKVVIEEFLDGIELSCFILTDGKTSKTLPFAKDYKKIGEGDTGLNTGGMGAVSPVPFLDNKFLEKIEERLTEKKDEDTLAMVSKLIEDLIEDDMEAEKVFRQAVKNFIDDKIEEQVVERAFNSGSIAQA